MVLPLSWAMGPFQEQGEHLYHHQSGMVRGLDGEHWNQTSAQVITFISFLHPWSLDPSQPPLLRF